MLPCLHIQPRCTKSSLHLGRRPGSHAACPRDTAPVLQALIMWGYITVMHTPHGTNCQRRVFRNSTLPEMKEKQLRNPPPPILPLAQRMPWVLDKWALFEEGGTGEEQGGSSCSGPGPPPPGQNDRLRGAEGAE